MIPRNSKNAGWLMRIRSLLSGIAFFAVASFPADHRRKNTQKAADFDPGLRKSAPFFCGDLREK